MRVKALVPLVFCLAPVLACGGRPASDPVLVLDLEARPVDAFAGQEGPRVFVFVRTDCPIANRYAPELRRIHDEYAARGIAFFLVYPDRSESVEAIRSHLAEYGLPGPALRDPDHALVRRAGASVTPEAAVFSADGGMVYRGRIDDRFVSLGTERPRPIVWDLREALEAVLAGRPVAEPTTPAVGCLISGLE